MPVKSQNCPWQNLTGGVSRALLVVTGKKKNTDWYKYLEIKQSRSWCLSINQLCFHISITKSNSVKIWIAKTCAFAISIAKNNVFTLNISFVYGCEGGVGVGLGLELGWGWGWWWGLGRRIKARRSRSWLYRDHLPTIKSITERDGPNVAFEKCVFSGVNRFRFFWQFWIVLHGATLKT